MLEKCVDVNAHFIADTFSGQGQNVLCLLKISLRLELSKRMQ